MRAIGLDIGSKTIGVALTDEARIAAHPHSVLARAGESADVAAVIALITTHTVTSVVVGMPFELSGRLGHRGRRVQKLANAIRAALPAGVEYAEQDERFTTAEAERVLIAGGASRADRKDMIDSRAAALILAGWLEKASRAK